MSHFLHSFGRPYINLGFPATFDSPGPQLPGNLLKFLNNLSEKFPNLSRNLCKVSYFANNLPQRTESPQSVQVLNDIFIESAYFQSAFGNQIISENLSLCHRKPNCFEI